MDYITLGGERLGITNLDTAIIDTGTSVIVVRQDVVDALTARWENP
jgi:hypothetical protein